MIKSINKKKIISFLLIIVMCLSNSWVIMATDSQDQSVESIDFMVGTGEELKTVLENADETPINIHITDDITLDGIDIKMPEEVKVDITVKSDSSGVYTLTKSDGRHFKFYESNLALENIILDGESTGGGVEIESGNLTISDGTVIQNCFSQESGGGVSMMRSGNLTISGGTVIQNCFSQRLGGGVYVDGSPGWNSSTINVSDSTIINNTGSAGGGLYIVSYIIINIIDSEISGNTASYWGGGICLSNEDSSISEYSVISGSIINDNICSMEGGGIQTTYVNLRLSDNEISRNKARNGGGINCGATSVEGYGVVECTNTTISSNIAKDCGGGINASTLTFIMSESEISENIAESGGGMYTSNATCIISESKISRNTAKSGGGLSVEMRSSFTAENCEITENMAKYDSGVLMDWDSKFIFDGGRITNNTTIEDAD